jgi:hypothetical protein
MDFSTRIRSAMARRETLGWNTIESNGEVVDIADTAAGVLVVPGSWPVSISSWRRHT